jgi:osmotically-inducible protein OsmY
MTHTLHKTDHELKTAVVEELAWTPSVNADNVGVSVHEGAVTLSGQVRTYPEKQHAIRAAMRVSGVTAVADELTVASAWAPRDDTDIAVEATEALDRLVHIPAGAVKAQVHNRVITLSGEVAWQYQRDEVRRAMIGLRGVNGVVNNVTLKPTVPISPALAKAKITAALVRNAQVDAGNVHVDVTGTVIRLTGTVSSWAERRQAEYSAWSTPGVTHVDNRLAVSG